MIYLSNFILNESWKTYTPSKNPKILLYDFYVLSYLSTLPLDPTQKGFSGSLIGRNPNEIKLDIEHAQSVLLPVLVKKLKNALFLGICAELRHIFDKPQNYSLFKDNKLFKYYTRYYSSLTGNVPDEFKLNRDVKNPRVTAKEKAYLISYKAAMMAIKKAGSSTIAFAELARDLFKEMNWASSYGGNKWAEIADGYLLLAKAHTNNEKQIAIDHAYDLQHNTGTALNKVKDFAINTNFAWIQVALDHKRDAKSMYELLPECSSDMKKLALEAFKIANVKKPTSSNGIRPSDINLLNKLNDPNDVNEFNIGDEVVYQGTGYKVYGKIIDKKESISEDIAITTNEPEPVSKKYDYTISITELEGKIPSYLMTDNKFVVKSYDSASSKDLKLVKKSKDANPVMGWHEKSTTEPIVPGNIYNMPEYGCLFYVNSVKPASYPYEDVAEGNIHFIYDIKLFEELNKISSKLLSVGSSTSIHTNYLTQKNVDSYYAKDASNNLLKVGNEYVAPSYGGAKGKLVQIHNTKYYDSNNGALVALQITSVPQNYFTLKVGDIAPIQDKLVAVDNAASKTIYTPPNDVNEFIIGDIVSAENGTVNGIVVDMDHAGNDPFYIIKITSVDTEANKKYSSGVVNTRISYYPKDLTLIKPAVVKEIPSVKNENSTHTLNTDGVPMVPGRLYTYGNNLVFKLLHLLTDSYLGMKMAEVENIKTKAHVSITIDDLSYDYTSNIAFDANGDDISIAKYYKYNYVGVYAGTLIVYPKKVYANTNGGAQSPRITCEVVQVFTANPPHAVGSRIVVTPYRLVPVLDEQI
jgi:hypothetical protein